MDVSLRQAVVAENRVLAISNLSPGCTLDISNSAPSGKRSMSRMEW